LEVRGKLELGIEIEPAGDSGAEARGCDPQPFRPHPNFTPIPMPALPAAEQGVSEEEALKTGTEEKSKELIEKGAEVYAKA
jgi:hypothetical protein